MKNSVGDKMKRNKNSGIAILSTLLLLVLLLGLITAFLTVSRASGKFTVNSIQRSQAQNVAETVLSYIQFHLEKERSWGASTAINGTENYPYSPPSILHLDMSQVQSSQLATFKGQYSNSGNFSNPDATFEATLENNLNTRIPVTTGSDGPVPARSAKITIRVTIGTQTSTMVTMLRPVPLSHDSLSAGKNLNLADTQGLVRLESRDPYINRIRASNNLNLPSAENVRFLKHGSAASFNELNLSGLNLASSSVSEDAVKQAGEESGGIYLPNRTNAEAPIVKPFDPAKVTLPQTATPIPGGTWSFNDANKVEYKPAKLKYRHYKNGGGSGSGSGSGSYEVKETQRYQRVTSTYNHLLTPDGKNYVAKKPIPKTTVKDPPDLPDEDFEYDSEADAEQFGFGDSDKGDEGFGFAVDSQTSGKDVYTLKPGFMVNVSSAEMVVLPGYRLESPGNFLVIGSGDRLPELYFGYGLTSGGVANQLSLADGIKEAQDKPEKYMAGIIAQGDVNVTGGLVGYGSVLAGGELTIKASSGLRIAPELGVVVKGQNIIINPATEPEPSQPGEPVKTDNPIFREAIQADSNGDWSAYNSWLEHDQAQRDTMIASLSAQSTGSDASVLWGTLCTEIKVSLPTPDFSAYGWPSGAITVAQYVRLKEFLQTLASGYNGGSGDDSWLDLNQRADDVDGRVAGTLNTIAQWARSYKLSFQQYLLSPDQTPPDMFLAGLVYAENDLNINSQGKSVRLEGTVVSRNGNVTIQDATNIDLVYNRNLLDDITFFNPTGPMQLERVFTTLD